MDIVVRCNLRSLRESRGINQEHLADLVGTHKGNVSKYENDEVVMNVVTAAKFAIVLDCTLDQLYSYASAGEV